CAPQSLSAGTRTSPRLSVSLRNSAMSRSFVPDQRIMYLPGDRRQSRRAYCGTAGTWSSVDAAAQAAELDALSADPANGERNPPLSATLVQQQKGREAAVLLLGMD